MGLAQDLRFAIRVLVKDRWFSAVAALTLALGISVNTTVFVIVNAVLIRGLPIARELLAVETRTTSGHQSPSSYPDFEDWRAQARAFADLGAFRSSAMNVSDSGHAPERIVGAFVTANTFGLLRQPPLLGRDFAPGDDRPDAEPVVILGYGVWRNRYGGDPAAIGRVVKVNGVACTVIGVMPQGVEFPASAGMWRPLVDEGSRPALRGNRSIHVFGRLAPGATRDEAQVEMSGIAARLSQAYPETNAGLDVRVTTFNERLSGGQIHVVFLALTAAVGFVLLIACANVANMLMARSARRAREVAVRVALGASRARILRQLLVESLVLASLGGLLGLGFARVGVRLFDLAVADTGKPYWIQFTFDPVVFAYLAAICLATGVIFGLAPALHVSRTNVNETLKDGARGTAGGRRASAFRSTMVVVELTLTVVLFVGAGLMVRSLLKLSALDLGIETGRLLTMQMELPERNYPGPEQRRAFHDALLSRVQGIPGVRAAAVATALPGGGAEQRELELDGHRWPQDHRAPRISSITISPSYFDVVGLGMSRGRGFTPADGTQGSEVAIVNERFVAQFMTAEDPIGRRVRLRAPARGVEPAGTPGEWLTIVGVAPTIRQGDPQSIEPAAVVYTPYRQEPVAFVKLLARSHADPGALAALVRRTVQEVDSDQPVYDVRTLDQFLARMQWPFRVFGTMFTIFAIAALLLSAVGVYAVTACSVSQRTQEIGVRMALGARAGQVSWMILRQGFVHLAIGLTIGLALGAGVGKVLQGLLVQVAPHDPVTFGAIVVVLVGATVAACLIPARRAARMDPLAALRVE